MTQNTCYSSFLRPLLFKLPAETAHGLGRAALKRDSPWRLFRPDLVCADPRLAVNLGGLKLLNPVGLSAGFDKDAEALGGLQHLGFGYITVGSVLPERRSGNPRPRLKRLPETESLLNCYGLPSKGLEACVANLKKLRTRRTPVVVNIDAPSLDLYLRSFAALEPYADAMEIGLQCPNNRDDQGEFHEPAHFERLISEIMKRRRKPVFIKILAYTTDLERQNRLDLVDRAARLGVDGVNVPGIWKQPDPDLSLGVATTSGRMCFQRTLEVVRDLASVSQGRLAIKANGGVYSGEDALAVFAAGATTVDLLSAFVYRGWTVARDINRELIALLDEHHIPDLQHLRSFAYAA